MATVRWTPQAADDLEAIVVFIARDSPRYARQFAVEVLAATERLSTFPQSGRVVPETEDVNVRQAVLGRYRLIYRLRADSVEILTIHHAARQLDSSVLR